jgi:DNA sulfur modification protein DndC
MRDNVLHAIDVCVEALKRRADAHWVLGFSGGKDSSAALKIFLSAYRRASVRPTDVTLIYCDTGVENPILDAYVKTLLRRMQLEFDQASLPIRTRILKAPVQDRFFVRLIGRGYPPPTNSFRWCTTGLRIRPVSQFIRAHKPEDTVLLLGLRRSESRQRDRSLQRSADLYWQKQREGVGEYDLFLPIVEMDVPEVWDAVFGLAEPRCLDAHALETLYRDASGECPVIKAPDAPPCASGRFGCWTCTVVRKDRSGAELIRAGHEHLIPFYRFRHWLTEIRNDPERRWPARRSGQPGMGPLTIAARREVLDRLEDLEFRTSTELLESEERGLIASLWLIDSVPRLTFPINGPRG